MDAISEASRNVSILLDRKIDAPPVPIKTVRKQDETNVTETQMYQAVEPVNGVKVFEVWKVFLEKDKSEMNEVYVVLSSDCYLKGYRNSKWENITYEGFYTTVEEAINEIKGYIR